MATAARSAPLPGPTGTAPLVEQPQFQEIVQRSRSLTQKILTSIPDTHTSCVHAETLQLNSTENSKLSRMAAIIRIPTIPVLKVVSENVTLESSLRLMHEGLQLHRASLTLLSARLENNEELTKLISDIRDLLVQINKMMNMAKTEGSVQPSPTTVDLHLPGEYEVQVAVHLTLVQLQSFGQDMVRCLRSLDLTDDKEAES
ncbi:uncharacterized protein LOC114481764 [Gouania willdenowi]|uniref:Uncharacterized LOC114481764 n=1 Tax=Gouania willdenowi TaxID=441366 RepID=A0A8C5GUQ5_GOUWI|nr:uncharacterized protein LOC114481764 [Gouania willdenowi]